jgi:hypothetical protein
MRRRFQVSALAVAVAGIATAGAMALYPVEPGPREELFEIPRGTWARRRGGDLV